MKKRILFYTWGEIGSRDITEGFENLNYEVEIFAEEMKNYLHDEEFKCRLKEKLKEDDYVCMFSRNFFPLIADVAKEVGIKYISWIFDSPHNTLMTESVFQKENYIFHFDRTQVEKLREKGVEHIYHMPLGVNSRRLNQILSCFGEKIPYQYDVSFMGHFYQDEYNFYDQIKNMPSYFQGYFDALIYTQMELYGYDLVSTGISQEVYNKISSFMEFQLDEKFWESERNLFISMVQKKITTIERPEILRKLSQYYDVSHWAAEKDDTLKNVKYRGYIEYYTDMPKMFHTSKINLNITLRTICSAIPLRCMDIMGAGGFLLSNYQPELDFYFENGKEMVMYESQNDLLDKVSYYLEHEEEREEIAKNGRKKMEDNYSNEALLTQILSMSGVG